MRRRSIVHTCGRRFSNGESHFLLIEVATSLVRLKSAPLKLSISYVDTAVDGISQVRLIFNVSLLNRFEIPICSDERLPILHNEESLFFVRIIVVESFPDCV